MILKISDLHKNLESPNNFYLFHGSNTGQIEEIIENIFKPKLSKNIYNYYESDVIDKIEEFKENILNKSFFDDDKLIIINRGTDKITGIIEDLIFKKITKVTIVIKSDILEKKSKLRILFEKNRETICIPFYDDKQKVLFSIAQSFFLKHKIKISSQNVNYIIEKSKNDRVNLKNELQKLFLFYKGNSIIEYKDIIKLIKSNKDHNLSDYADHFLVKDKKKLIKILNENSFVIDDNIILIKSILFKLKRLKKLKVKLIDTKNIDKIIDTFKPPIFWKEKELVKQQLKQRNLSDIKFLIKKVNNLEHLIKKNTQASSYILNNFILENIENSNNLF